MIKGLIFDFDGLILDTETPEFQVWGEIYNRHGYTLSADTWGQIVGGAGHSTFDPITHLESLVGGKLDRDSLQEEYRTSSDIRIAAQPVLPGVMDYLNTGRERGIKMAVASSSPHSWVDGHLARLNLSEYFNVVICADDVPPGRTKPHPDLFLCTLEHLGLEPDEAIIFEDSPNGVKAGKAAGITTVAVLNPFTAQLKVEGADRILSSLAVISLDDLAISLSH